MTVGISGLIIMLALVLLGVPLAFALMGVAFVAIYLLAGLPFALIQFTEFPREILGNFAFSVCPMFILMGQLAGELGLAEHGYAVARRWLSFSRGGVLSATFGASAIFGAISGSSIASAGFFAKVTVPELDRYGYDKSLGLGAIAAAGTLATLIPPSIMMVIFAMLTETSVGGLLIGGIVPGIILTSLMIVFLEVIARAKPKLIPRMTEQVSWKDRITALSKIWPIALTFVMIFGGIYGGFFTPTGAGAVGASVVFLIALQRRTKLKRMVASLKETVFVTSQVFFVVLGGILFSKMVVLSGMISSIITATSNLPELAVIFIVIGIYLVAGAVLDPVSMVVISVPFTFPLMLALGFHEIQIGIMVIILVEAAVITPPVGFNCYIVASAAKVDPMVVFRGMVPYFFIILLMLGLIVVFEPLSVWLPSTMY